MDDFEKLIDVDQTGHGLGAQMVTHLWAKMQAIVSSAEAAIVPDRIPLLPGASARDNLRLSTDVLSISSGNFSSALIHVAVCKTPQRISLGFPLVSSPLSPSLSPFTMVSGPLGQGMEPTGPVGAAADLRNAATDCTITNYFSRAELTANPAGALLIGRSIERWCTSLRVELVDARSREASDPMIERLGSALLDGSSTLLVDV